jgi:hypothetical protein
LDFRSYEEFLIISFNVDIYPALVGLGFKLVSDKRVTSISVREAVLRKGPPREVDLLSSVESSFEVLETARTSLHFRSRSVSPCAQLTGRLKPDSSS